MGLESYIAEDNESVSKSTRCPAGQRQNQLCASDADCPGSYCSMKSVGTQLGGAYRQLVPWTPNSAAAQYLYVLPSLPNGSMYANVGKAGTTGSREPSWCGAPGCTVTDGTITWVNRGPAKTVTLKNSKIIIEKPPNTKSADAYSLLAYFAALPRSLARIEEFTVNVPYVWQISAFGEGNDMAAEPPSPYQIPAGIKYGENDRWWSGNAPPNREYWKRGVRVWRADTKPPRPYWEVASPGWAARDWKASQSCPFGFYVVPPSANGHFYRATNAAPGKTGVSEPIWPKSSGASMADGACTWTESGAAAIFEEIKK
jgi:hypothetical protein